MPKSTDSINQDLEDLLASRGYEVTPLDSSGKEVPVSSAADLLQFHFHRDGKDYGTVTATIDGLQKLTIYYDDEIADSGGINEENGDRGAGDTSWFGLLKQLKKFAHQHQLGFVLKDTDRLRNDMKRRVHAKKLEESKAKEMNNKQKVAEGVEKTIWVKPSSNHTLIVVKSSSPDIEAGEEYDEGDLNNYANNFGYKIKDQGVAKGLNDTQKKIEDTILKLEQRLKFAKTPEQWDRISARIERLQAGLNRSKQGVAEGSEQDAHQMALEKLQKALKNPNVPAEKKKEIAKQIEYQRSKLKQGVAEGWKEKVAGGVLGAAALGGIGAGIAYSPMAYVNGQQIQMAMPTSIPDNAKLVTADDGRKIYVWKSNSIKGRAVWHYRPAEQVKEQGVAEGFGDVVKGIKRKVAGKEDPKDVEHMYARTARRDIDDANKLNNQAAYDARDKSVKRSKKISKVVNKEGVAANTQTKLDEGYYGNRKMSYSDDTPTVKMVIKHNRQLEETDQRFRHIEKIFLETSDGERFQVPTNKPSRARMFARHIAEGGAYRDDRWSHLNEICEDLDKLGGFVRATHNKREQFNESAQRMINEAQEQYQQLRETVKKLSGTKGYNKYFESYEPKVILEDDSDLSEAFMHSSIDTRIESALPTLSKFGIKMGKINESDMFSEWADSLVNETLDPDSPRQVEALVELLSAEIPVGPNAEVAIGELTDVIEDDELYNRLRRAAKANPDSDARPQIISWMQEQDNENYRQALEKIEADTSDSEKDQEELKKGNQSDAEEPAKVKPKKKQPQPGAQPAGGLPPLPPLPGGNAGGLPPLPPLPPLAEGDLALESFKRLLER